MGPSRVSFSTVWSLIRCHVRYSTTQMCGKPSMRKKSPTCSRRRCSGSRSGGFLLGGPSRFRPNTSRAFAEKWGLTMKSACGIGWSVFTGAPFIAGFVTSGLRPLSGSARGTHHFGHHHSPQCSHGQAPWRGRVQRLAALWWLCGAAGLARARHWPRAVFCLAAATPRGCAGLCKSVSSPGVATSGVTPLASVCGNVFSSAPWGAVAWA